MKNKELKFQVDNIAKMPSWPPMENYSLPDTKDTNCNRKDE